MMQKKKINVWLIAEVLFLVGFLSRYLLALECFSSLDSVQYAIGTFQYSLLDQTPSSYGVFLYIISGKVLNLFFNNPHDALMFLSNFYSGLITVMLFLLGRLLFGNLTGFIASVLFLTSPAFWYKGITIYAYLNAGFFILLTAFFCYRTIQGNRQYIYCAAVSYALLIGVRPQEFPMMLALFLFTLFHTPFKERMKAILIFVVSCLVWFIPFLIMSGGMQVLLKILGRGNFYLISTIRPIISKLNNRLIRMGQYFQKTYFLGIGPLIYYAGRLFYIPALYDNKKLQFLSLFIFPALLFNLSLQFSEIGHGLAWGLGLLFIIAESILVLATDIATLIKKFLRSNRIKDSLMVALEKGICGFIVLSIAAANIFMFFHDFNFSIFDYHRVIFDDRQFNYADAKNVDKYLSARIDYIRKNFDTSQIIIIPAYRFWRQLMFYFPKSIVIQSSQIHKEGQANLIYCQNMKCVQNKIEDKFDISPKISNVIISDEHLIPYARFGDGCRIIKLDDSSRILVVDVEKYEKIELGYHSIEFK